MTKIDVLLGLQWGDEGKGKIVDALTPHYDIIARFQGGPNAGHTLEFGTTKHVLHIIPSGIFHKEKTNLIGNGVLIEPRILADEIEQLRSKGVDATKNLLIALKAHLILPTHRMLDAANEQHKGAAKIGSTLKGIGPAYTDKTARNGLRIGDTQAKDFRSRYEALKKQHILTAKGLGFDVEAFRLDGMTLSEYEQQWFSALEKIAAIPTVSSEYFVAQSLKDNKRILAEGAQATMLDIDFGTYPFVTSSNTIAAGVCTGLGVAPSNIGKVFGITKAYCTRVGAGPFPTELFDETGKQLCEQGHEYGATTGRARRCGWMDVPALKYACMINGVTDLIVTKPDVMNNFTQVKFAESYTINGKTTEQVPYNYDAVDMKVNLRTFEGWQCDMDGARQYDALPEQLRTYLDAVERLTGTPISAISTSPDREDIVYKNDFFA